MSSAETIYATFDPYQQWLGIPPHEQPPNHYRLLGVPLFEPDTQAIANAADRLLAFFGSVTDPVYAQPASRLYTEVLTARNTLTQYHFRAQYDQWLQQVCGFSAPAAPVANVYPPQSTPPAPYGQSTPHPSYGFVAPGTASASVGNYASPPGATYPSPPIAASSSLYPPGMASPSWNSAPSVPNPAAIPQSPQPASTHSVGTLETAPSSLFPPPRTKQGSSSEVSQPATSPPPADPNHVVGPLMPPSKRGEKVESVQPPASQPSTLPAGLGPTIPQPSAMNQPNTAASGNNSSLLPPSSANMFGVPRTVPVPSVPLMPAPLPMAPQQPAAPPPEMGHAGWQVGSPSTETPSIAPVITPRRSKPPGMIIASGVALVIGVLVIAFVPAGGRPRPRPQTIAQVTPPPGTTPEPADVLRPPPPPNQPPDSTPTVTTPPDNTPPDTTPPDNTPPDTTPPKTSPPKLENPTTVIRPPNKNEPSTRMPTDLPPDTTPIPTTPTTTKNPDPSPAVSALDPAAAQKLANDLNNVRLALARREMDLALERLNVVRGLKLPPKEQADVNRLIALHEHLELFWKAVSTAMGDLKDADDITVKGTTVAVVEASPTKLILRVQGQNRTYQVQSLTPTLAMFLAQRWFKPIPSSKIFLGSFYAMDQQGDREEARRLWEEARQGGAAERDAVESLLPELAIPLQAPME